MLEDGPREFLKTFIDTEELEVTLPPEKKTASALVNISEDDVRAELL